MRGEKLLAEDLMDRDLQYDIDISGLRFLSGTSMQNPYQRALAKVLRQQMDNNSNPDSNSLAGWWIRGQGDWSAGAGREYQEPPTDEFVLRQFDSSAGIDTFTEPGFLTLLPKGVKIGDFAGSNQVFMANSGDIRFVASGAKAFRISDNALVEITGLTGTASSMLLAGAKLVVFTDQGGFTAGLTDTKFTQVYTTKAGAITGAWVKQRMILAQGPRLYEQTLPETSADFDVLKPFYTHPDSTYEWVAATNAPQAILLAGHGTAGSEIFAVGFDSSGKLPTTGVPISVAEFPPNERVTDMRSYLGAYISLATDKGVRVGTIADDSSNAFLTYGPLLNAPVPSGRFSMFDRFAVYPTSDAGDGRGGLVKVDLSVIDPDGRAAWSTFLRAGQSPARALSMLDHRVAIVADSDGNTVTIYSFKETNGLDAGWIQGGWVRFGTLEAKNFIDLTVITEPNPHGTIAVDFSDDEGVLHPLGSLDGQEGIFSIGLPFTMADGAARLTITPDEQGHGPKVNSWSLRALPTPKRRSELVQLILNCYDFERDMHGVTIGYSGRAAARWKALLSLLQDGATVDVRELNSSMSYKAMCEEISFTQSSAPAPDSGFGGVIAVTMRIV
jgi:hypothetical protein